MLLGVTYLPDINVDSWSNFNFCVQKLTDAMNGCFSNEEPDYNIFISSQFECPICYRSSVPNVVYLTPGAGYFFVPQILYQLSHELCHLRIGNGTLDEYMWIEETICALASFIFPIYCSEIFCCGIPEYISDEESKIEKIDIGNLNDKSSKLFAYLIDHSCDRAKNSYIASLLKPIALSNPRMFWKLFCYLPSIKSGLSLSEVITELAFQAANSDKTQSQASWNDLKSDILTSLFPVIE